MAKEKILLPISFTYNLVKAHNLCVHSNDEFKLLSFLQNIFNNVKIESEDTLYEVYSLIKDDKDDKKILKEFSEFINGAHMDGEERKIRVLIVYTNHFTNELIHILRIGFALGFYVVLGTTRKVTPIIKAGCPAMIDLDY